MKIPVKNLYLIAIISIGLIGLAVGSTYAMFTATAEINNPISLASNLTYTSDIVETVDVSVAPGETEYVTLDVSNSSGSTLNYAIWYICDNDDVEFGTDLENYSDSTSGNIASGSYFPIGVYIRNNGTSTVTVTLGVSSSTGNVILANNMTILPNTSLPVITHTVTIKRQLGTASATTIQNLSANDGSNSSQVSVAGTTAYPTYESISCTNGQTASVTKTTSGGIDTAKVTVNNVKSDTVCTVKFKSSSSYTVTIKRQLGSGTATTVQTLNVNGGSNSSAINVEGTASYPIYDSISCTNSQNGSVTTSYVNPWRSCITGCSSASDQTACGDECDANYSNVDIYTARATVNNVTSNTVCTVKFKNSTSTTSHTVNIYLDDELIGTCVANHGDTCYESIRIDYDFEPTALICDNGNSGSVYFNQVDDRFFLEVEILDVDSDDNCSIVYY